MITTQKSVWLGYTSAGDKLTIPGDELKNGMVVLGNQAQEVSSLFVFACVQAGLHPVVLDMGGQMTERVSGYLETYSHNEVIFDALRIEDSERTHAQLIASAYTCGMGLTSVQESLLNAALLSFGLQNDVASPAAIHNQRFIYALVCSAV